MLTDARHVVAQELAWRESLVWYGHPALGIRLRSSDVYMIPFSIAWGAVAVFCEYSVVTSNSSPYFVLWGIPFIAMGLYLIAGRFLHDASRRASTFYGITDRRILFISGSYEKKVTSLSLSELPEMTLSERAGGLGTIRFSSGEQFELIEDARVVYQIIRNAKRRGNGSGRIETREPVTIGG
jgi:hypothetical protein